VGRDKVIGPYQHDCGTAQFPDLLPSLPALVFSSLLAAAPPLLGSLEFRPLVSVPRRRRRTRAASNMSGEEEENAQELKIGEGSRFHLPSPWLILCG
jgi:hypothetical protein